MTEYLISNWDGWPLHVLIAAVLTHPFITNNDARLMFAMHLIFWPMREAWQHDGIVNIWEMHQIIEWGAPIIASFVVMLIALRWPYKRKRR